LPESLSEIAGKKHGARRPKTSIIFGHELRRIAPQLRLHGISISFERSRGARIVTSKSEGTTTSRPSTDNPQP
jgi:hypothetical protein